MAADPTTGLSVALGPAREAGAESVISFLAAVAEFDELALLDPSRCRGWSRLDVVSHVLAGWQEMLGGLVSPVSGPATVDAASYWAAFEAQYATDDTIPVLMAQKRRSLIASRPSSVVAECRDVGEQILRGIASACEGHCTWQGHTFTTGDFLAIWAIEDVVHELDLLAGRPAAPSALALTRRVVEALVGRPAPAEVPDVEVALIGTGRVAAPEVGPAAGLRRVLG